MKAIFQSIRKAATLIAYDLSMLPTRLYTTVFTALILLVGPGAHAQGLTRLFSGWSGVVSAALNFMLLISVLIAAYGVMSGIWQLIQKGRGRQDEVEMRQIVYPVVGGSLMAIVMFILTGMVEEAGGSSSDIGRNPIRP